MKEHFYDTIIRFSDGTFLAPDLSGTPFCCRISMER